MRSTTRGRCSTARLRSLRPSGGDSLMYPIQQFNWDNVPPSLAYQIASFMRIQWLHDLKGEDRFWNFFDSPEVVAHFTISERDVLISHALVRRRIIEHLGKS